MDAREIRACREHLMRSPMLRYAFIELTERCNLRCKHCGSSCRDSADRAQVASEYIYRAIDDIVSHTHPRDTMFCITGGEPLLRGDWFEICSYIARKGYSWGMTTNGTLIDEKCLERLIQAGMKTVSVSLDGGRQAHDELRCVPGSYDAAVRGIKLLSGSGAFKEVQITTVVSTLNIDSLDEIKSIVLGLGVDSWKIASVEPIGRARENGELMLSAEQYRRLFDYISEERKKGDIDVTYGCSHYLPEKYNGTVRQVPFLCIAGLAVASITASGDIVACLDIDDRGRCTQGNIVTDSFWDVWTRRFEMFRKPKYPESAVCAGCPDREECGGDSWHTWDLETWSPRLCLYDILRKTEGKDREENVR